MEPNSVTNADGTSTVKRYRHAGDLTGEPPTREVMSEINVQIISKTFINI